MRKITILFGVLIAAFVLTSCGQQSGVSTPAAASNTPATTQIIGTMQAHAEDFGCDQFLDSNNLIQILDQNCQFVSVQAPQGQTWYVGLIFTGQGAVDDLNTHNDSYSGPDSVVSIQQTQLEPDGKKFMIKPQTDPVIVVLLYHAGSQPKSAKEYLCGLGEPTAELLALEAEYPAYTKWCYTETKYFVGDEVKNGTKDLGKLTKVEALNQEEYNITLGGTIYLFHHDAKFPDANAAIVTVGADPSNATNTGAYIIMRWYVFPQNF